MSERSAINDTPRGILRTILGYRFAFPSSAKSSFAVPDANQSLIEQHHQSKMELVPSPITKQNTVTFSIYTKEQILEASSLLCRFLPTELVSKILEDGEFNLPSHMGCRGRRVNSEYWEDQCCWHIIENKQVAVLSGVPINGTLERPLRRVIIQTTSHDQGWSSYRNDHDTYNNSWTWFDVTLERPRGSGNGWMEIYRRKLWNNVHALGRNVTHVIDMGGEEEIVRSAIKGDRLCVWAGAKFPGWRNIIDRVDMWTFAAVH